MRTVEPLLLTDRIDRAHAHRKPVGRGWLWFGFDLLVFAAVVLFFG